MKIIWTIALMVSAPQLAWSQCDSLALGLLDSTAKCILASDFKGAQKLLDRYKLRCVDIPDTSIQLVKFHKIWADLAQSTGNYQDAEKSIRIALSAYRLREDQKPHSLAGILTSKAIIEYRLGKFEAVKVTADSARLLALQGEKPSADLATALNLLGGSWDRSLQTWKAIPYYEEALKVSTVQHGPESMAVGRTLNNISSCYSKLGQYQKSISHIEKAIRIYKRHHGPDYIKLSSPYFNLGVYLSDCNEYEKAIAHFLESARVIGLQFKDHHSIAERYRRAGDAYRLLQDFDKAKELYDLAQEIYGKAAQKPDQEALLFWSRSRLSAARHEYSRALSLIDSALQITAATWGSDHARYGAMVTAKMEYLISMDQFAEAIEVGKTSLNIFQYDHAWFDPANCPRKLNLYQNLGHHAQAYFGLYNSSHQRAHLDLAEQYLENAIDLVYFLRIELEDERSKHDLSLESMYLYEEMAAVVHELFTITGDPKFLAKGLEYCEKSRQSAALEAILSRSNQGFPGVPASTLTRERSLSSQIARVEQVLRKQAADLPAGHLWADSLYALNQQRTQFLDSLSTHYPVYYEHRYQSAAQSAKEWQSQLAPGLGVLEFLDADDYVYQFLVTGDTIRINRIPRDVNLETALNVFHTHTSDTYIIMSDPDASHTVLKQACMTLYELLLGDLLSDLKLQELVIVPDGLESRIIFDILQPKDDLYLFDRFQIQYAQSLHFWLKQQHFESSPSLSFTGFAPEFGEARHDDVLTSDMLATIVRSGDMQLPAAAGEVRAIRDVMGGRAFLADQASRKSLLRDGVKAQVLHFSTHAILDEDEPAYSMFLMSSDNDSTAFDPFTSSEICHVDFEAELAVLSACHTGYGKVSRGEGVLSLGRAFAFAGVPAIVQSLWKVPDQTTAQFMPHFYRGLLAGQAKHEALNQARRIYLEQTSSSKLRHPYFWAGFVLYGNAQPIEPLRNGNGVVLIAIVGMGLLTIGGFRLLRRKDDQPYLES